MDSDSARYVRRLLGSGVFKAAKEEALGQLKLEVQNRAVSCSPISDPMAVENLLRSQGEVRGVLRFFEILEELGEVDGGRTDDDTDE